MARGYVLPLSLAAMTLLAGAIAAPPAPERAAEAPARSGVSAETWTDPFDYPDHSGGEPYWRTDSVAWAVAAGAMRFRAGDREFAVLQALPQGRRVTLEATLRLDRRLRDGWAVAGVAVRLDAANYWHLALVEAPRSEGGGRVVELGECLDGRWRAELGGPGRLPLVADDGTEFRWAYGRPYRLRIALQPGRIEGTVTGPGGKLLRRIAWRLDGGVPAVTSGRPALDASLFAGTFDDLHAEVADAVPDPAPEADALVPYDAPGCAGVPGRRTGFFHVEQHDDTWWFIDPAGAGFYAVGVDHPNYNAHWCQELGYAPYHRNVEAAYGGEEAWADAVAGRLQQWGFNAVGWGHSTYLRHRRFAHVEVLAVGSGFVRFDNIVQRTTWTGFPNVFSPLWPRHCDQVAARLCAPNREDPWLLGYFLDNELEWHGKAWNDPFGLWTETWRKPDRHSAKRAWLRIVRKHCPTVQDANRALGTGFGSFDELAASTEPQPVRTGAARAMATEYVRLVADRYFREAAEAIRRHDPNHLVLGTRFPDWSPGVWDLCGRYCDVVSVNSYPRTDVDRGVPMDWVRRYRRVHEEAGKPLIFTEWSFPALDSGLPCTIGAGMRVATQTQRARCFTAFQRTLFGLPFVVGSTYFMYIDEPALGVSDTFPENTNYGLVNENDEPYAELTAAAAAVNPRACAVHLEARLDDVYEPQPVAWDRRLPSQEAPARALSLATGPLTLSPADRGLAWHLQRDGVVLGSYAPTVHQHDGQDHWTRPTDTRVAAVRADGHFTVVDMEFAHEGGAAPPAYRAGWRFWVPRRSSGWFAAQSLWVENSDARPWRLAGLFHYILPSVGGSPDDDVAAFAGVPNFYLDLAAWEDAAAGLGLGVLAPYGDLAVTYWKDQDGFHSDCRQPLDVWLDPGATYEAAGPVAVHFAYEAAGLPELLAAAEVVRREVEELRRP